MLEELTNVEMTMDDILIHADTQEKLLAITNSELNKLNNSSLKLNKEKLKMCNISWKCGYELRIASRSSKYW